MRILSLGLESMGVTPGFIDKGKLKWAPVDSLPNAPHPAVCQKAWDKALWQVDSATESKVSNAIDQAAKSNRGPQGPWPPLNDGKSANA